MTIDFSKIQTPCYLIEEALLRKNLRLIQSVKEEAGVNIILAFKGLSMWKVFPIVREYISGAAASGAYEAKLAAEEMKTLAHTYWFRRQWPPAVSRTSSIPSHTDQIEICVCSNC